MQQNLGFTWHDNEIPEIVPVDGVKRALFRIQKMLPEFVWDASYLEGNPFTFPEVKTLMDGITVGGHKITDHDQVVNLVKSFKHLLTLVRSGQFSLTKEVFCGLQSLVASEEALEWGLFRGEGEEKNYSPDVGLGALGVHKPLPTEDRAPRLNEVFFQGVEYLTRTAKSEFDLGVKFFLFGALQQFFFDGNKRTSRLMMNGVLMSAGMDAISVPAAKAHEFNEKMVRFYQGRNADEMIDFMIGCHPEADLIRKSHKMISSGAGKTLDDLSC